MINSKIDKIAKLYYNKIILISFLFSVFYFTVRTIDCLFLIGYPIGDERYYLNDYLYLMDNGFYTSVLKGISIPFSILYYFINKMTGFDQFSIRLASFFATISMIAYFYFRLKIFIKEKLYFFMALLFLIASTGATIHGTNDSLFFLFLIIFIFETVVLKESVKYNVPFRILSVSLVIMIRPVSIIYIPILILSLILFKIIDRKKSFDLNYKTVFLTILFGITFSSVASIPRFSNKNYSLSYTDKSIFQNRGVTWTEWVYHSQLIGNMRGTGLFVYMDTWEKALKYKILNGDSSLPNTYYDYLFHDLSFLIKRIFSSIVEVLIISIRYVWFSLIFLPFLIFKRLKNNLFDSKTLLLIISLIGVLTWIIIWPGLVQHRWIYPFYILIIFCFSNFSFGNLIKSKKLILFNVLGMDLIIFWFLWKERFFAGVLS